MSLVLNGSGTITGLSAGGLPDGTIVQADLATGVAGTGPAFSATYSGATSVATATFTKLLAATTRFDTSSAYASSTFNPKIAGYYQINYATASGVSALGYVGACFYKNGSLYTYGSVVANSSAGPWCNGSILMYLNGSTDYVEIYGYQNSGSSMNYYLGDFSGVLVRAA